MIRRFVILANRQQYPNPASRALSLCLKRLSADWQQAYGHPVVMVETFVDRASYQATALKQAWAKGRPRRAATSRDWVEENQFNRRHGIRLIIRSISSNRLIPKNRQSPRRHGPNRA